MNIRMNCCVIAMVLLLLSCTNQPIVSSKSDRFQYTAMDVYERIQDTAIEKSDTKFNRTIVKTSFGTIRVKSMKKVFSECDTSFQYACSKWHLNADDVQNIIKESELITSHEMCYIFNTLSCRYIGKLIHKNKMYDFEVNSGSYIRIENQDTTIFLGYFGKKRYFVLPPDTLSFDD